ncbi:glycerophosphodiester phosphodiesterase [Planctomyces sp. SH-PL62]|uniref:glycerophosphodiester phosphodiesterase n=1 Tax=Planctomyces sp. SH-PL62 TaxID=1636152 RepID=UPI00078CA37D|nr:glycerophosphodiester phosphodiesterase [Planctomyces sp. SH-PL62]AMV36554.1 Glycerophosphoryl diester phosphodiesterase [Planctomyces sp. SH-PL62]
MAWTSSLLMLLTIGTLGPEASNVEFVSHRGESADAPENTLAAFNLAWDRKVEAVELDVHLSRDGVLVVTHDADAKRTTGVEKKIKETDWADLKDLDAGRWKDAKWAGETMPTLEESLATIPDGARIFIELKTGPEIVAPLVEAVHKSGKKPEQMAIISFHAETVAESKKRLPELKAYFLSGFKTDRETKAVTPTVDELIAKAKELNADGLDLAYTGPIDRAFVDRVKSAGLAFYVWTVDDPDVARRLIAAGVDGITTNKAEWLKRQLAAE